jgi:hypothetical protein
MLNQVKQYISNLTEDDFNAYYYKYMLDVQDKNIDRELKRFRSRNVLSLYSMDRLIAQTLSEVNLDGASNKVAELI